MATSLKNNEDTSGIGQGESAGNASNEVDVCLKAPEWAEHQRFSDKDMPCDDGRAG